MTDRVGGITLLREIEIDWSIASLQAGRGKDRMIMAGQKVTAGKYYVNNARSIAREVLAIKKNAVIFVTYHLDTGNSVGYPSECMKQHFTRWADHEATPTEIASLEKFKMHAPPL